LPSSFNSPGPPPLRATGKQTSNGDVAFRMLKIGNALTSAFHTKKQTLVSRQNNSPTPALLCSTLVDGASSIRAATIAPLDATSLPASIPLRRYEYSRTFAASAGLRARQLLG